MSLTHPHRSPERKRCRLASALVGLVDEAERPTRAFSAAVPVQAHAILRSRSQLLQLADDLETTSEPVNERGVGLVEQLLRDGSSPIYAPLGDEALDVAVRHARAALLLD